MTVDFVPWGELLVFLDILESKILDVQTGIDLSA